MATLNALSDAELIALLKTGDQVAFTTIYERYDSLLYIYAHKKLLHKQEAQDIVQEVLTVLWKKRFELVLQGSLTNYLYTAVRNRALDVFAHRKVQAKYIDSLQVFMDENRACSDFRIRENDLKAIIEREIAALPPKMQEIFRLSREGMLTHREIAEGLDLSEHTVSTQIKRALRILRVRLGLITFISMLIFYRF